MRGMLGYCLIAAAALMASCHAITMEETCAIVPNNTFIGNPKSCDTYGYCLNGALAGTGSCRKDYNYDMRNSMCKPENETICEIPEDDDFCLGQDNVFKAHPDNCEQYIYCNKSIVQYGKCPSGQNYFADKNSCVWPSEYACSVGSPCEYCADNVFVQDVTSCDGYFRCSRGAAYAGKCDAGYFYEARTGRCNYANLVNCNVPPPVQQETTPSPKPDTCSGGKEYVTDSASCRGYFYCDLKDPNAKGVWGQCPLKTHFSPAIGKCIYTDGVSCSYDRCDGIDSGWVATYNSGCTAYDTCKGGKKTYSSLKCTTPGYPYFDEVAQLCTKSVPNYEICKPT